MSNELSTNPEQSKEVSVKNPAYQVPEYMRGVVDDRSEINKYAKPPFIKIVEANSGLPYKPPFSAGDIVLAPQKDKLGDENTPVVFVPIHFWTTFTCLNPIATRGMGLPAVREISFDESSELAKKCKNFMQYQNVPCPELPTKMLKFATTLNFIIIMEDHDRYASFPVWMFYARGRYAEGQVLVGLIQSRWAPKFGCRFKMYTRSKPGKEGGTYTTMNFLDDPQMHCTEENFKRYELLNKNYIELINSRRLDLSQGSEELQAAVDSSNAIDAEAAKETKF